MVDIVDSRYKIIDRVATGGQATTYLALDTVHDNRKVLLKLFPAAAVSPAAAWEFRRLASLDHPSIVRIFGLGFSDHEGRSQSYVAEQWVDGRPSDLYGSSLRASRGDEAFFAWYGEFLLKAALALHYIHERGLLHRDIKPAHILVSGEPEDFTITYIDFGLASLIGDKGKKVCGTPGFIAPECLKGHYSVLSDLYALGASAFVTAGGTLTRRSGSSLVARIDGRCIEEVFPPDRSALARILQDLLARDPFERLPSARALTERILAASDFEPGSRQAAPPVLRPAFVGREKILDRIVDEVAGRLGGRNQSPVAVILKGARGMGKSAAFEQVRNRIVLRAAGRGSRPPTVIEGGHMGLHAGSVPDGASLDGLAADPGSQEAASKRAAAVMSAAEAGPALFIFHGPGRFELETLIRLCRDLKWAEASKYPIALLVEWDSDCGSDLMEELSVMEGVVTRELDPLTGDETARLLKSSLGEKADASLLRVIAERSGGRPLFALELASIAAAGNFRLSAGDIPSSARDITAAGMAGLPELALRLLKAAALARVFLDLSAAARALDARPAEIAEASALLSGRGWIELAGDRFRPHPLVADAVAESMTAAEAASMHGALARGLSSAAGPPERLAAAYHALMAGDGSARKTFLDELERLEQASGFERGSALMDDVLTARPDALGPQGRLTAARFFRATGAYEKALEALGETEASGGNGSLAEARFERAAVLRLTGRSREAADILGRLLKRGGLSPSLAGKAAGLLCRIMVDEGRYDEARRVAGAALDKNLSDPVRIFLLEPLAMAETASGRHVEARRLLEMGLSAAVHANLPVSEARYLGLLGMLGQKEARYDQAIGRYQEAARAARRTGDQHGYSVYCVNEGSVLMELGRYADAMVKFNEARHALEAVGGWRELAGVLLNAANLRVRVGDAAGARADVRRCAEVARHYEVASIPPLLSMLEGDMAVMEEAFDEAAERYAEAERQLREQGNEPYALLAALAGAESLVFAGRLDESGRVLARLTSGSETERAQWLGDRASLVRALLEAERGGNPASGLELLQPALDGFRRRGEKDLVLAAEAVLVRLRLESGEREAAAERFRRAVRIANDMRRESLALGYDPARTNPYMKFLRKVANMKDLGFSPFSGAESSRSEPGENKWARLAQITKRINSELRLRPLLELVLDAMMDMTRAARGYIILKDSDGSLQIKCARDIDPERLGDEETSFSRSIVKRVIDNASPVITVDAASDEHLRASESVVEMNLKSVMAVPLMAKGRVMGAVYVDNPYAVNMFSQDDVSLLMTFADQAGIALENARLLRENRRRERKIERLNRRLERLLGDQKVELAAMRETLERSLAGEGGGRRYAEIVGESEPMQKIFRLLDRIAETELPAVLVGASGTGKELVARAIHFNSPRKTQPFVTENCGAIPDSLLESVLFGHVKGAFTGADRSRPGLFEMANHGTLFLDEIDSMSLPMQTKLLRTLQDGVIRPLGGNLEKRVDVRVIAATGTRLDSMVKEEKFREDLYYRINVITIELPQLRERLDDIPLLVTHFIEKHAADRRIEISRGAMRKLMDYDWPGNVRQLENEITRAIVLCEGKITEEAVLQEIPGGRESPVRMGGSLNMRENVEKLETALIAAALRSTGGNQSAAARILGISRFGLIKKIARYGLGRE